MITHKFDNTDIQQLELDILNKGVIIPEDYENATQLCKIANKQFGDYKRLNSTKNFFLNLSEILNIDIEKLVIYIHSGDRQCTWVHPHIFKNLINWIIDDFNNIKIKQTRKEEEIRNRIWKNLGGDIEVPTMAGRIDLLTEKEIIEVKCIKKWKEAVGQVTIFSKDYPKHSKRIHLFGKCSGSFKHIIFSYCKKLNILVSYEDEMFTENPLN